jgi:hypothetical protein
MDTEYNLGCQLCSTTTQNGLNAKDDTKRVNETLLTVKLFRQSLFFTATVNISNMGTYPFFHTVHAQHVANS